MSNDKLTIPSLCPFRRNHKKIFKILCALRIEPRLRTCYIVPVFKNTNSHGNSYDYND